MKSPHVTAIVFVMIIGWLLPQQVSAQAWVAPKGETTVSMSWMRGDFPGHLEDSGNRLEVGDSYSRSLLLEVETSLTDRLAVSVGIPYVSTRNGDDPSPVAGRSGIDDGNWHGTWQDWRLTARYNVLSWPVVLTPFVRLVIPSRSYQTRAEAAPGRDLHESIIGVDAGRMLTRVKNTYVHLRLSHAFVEELAGISTDRTNGEITVGTFVTPALTLSVSSAFQDTHGGLTDVHALGPDATEDEFLEHDRLLADDNVRVGFGAAYALNSRWSVNAGFATVVSGSNSHYGRSYLLGLQWTTRSPR